MAAFLGWGGGGNLVSTMIQAALIFSALQLPSQLTLSNFWPAGWLIAVTSPPPPGISCFVWVGIFQPEDTKLLCDRQYVYRGIRAWPGPVCHQLCICTFLKHISRPMKFRIHRRRINICRRKGKGRCWCLGDRIYSILASIYGTGWIHPFRQIILMQFILFF